MTKESETLGRSMSTIVQARMLHPAYATAPAGAGRRVSMSEPQVHLPLASPGAGGASPTGSGGSGSAFASVAQSPHEQQGADSAFPGAGRPTRVSLEHAATAGSGSMWRGSGLPSPGSSSLRSGSSGGLPMGSPSSLLSPAPPSSARPARGMSRFGASPMSGAAAGPQGLLYSPPNSATPTAWATEELRRRTTSAPGCQAPAALDNTSPPGRPPATTGGSWQAQQAARQQELVHALALHVHHEHGEEEGGSPHPEGSDAWIEARASSRRVSMVSMAEATVAAGGSRTPLESGLGSPIARTGSTAGTLSNMLRRAVAKALPRSLTGSRAGSPERTRDRGSGSGHITPLQVQWHEGLSALEEALSEGTSSNTSKKGSGANPSPDNPATADTVNPAAAAGASTAGGPDAGGAGYPPEPGPPSIPSLQRLLSGSRSVDRHPSLSGEHSSRLLDGDEEEEEGREEQGDHVPPMGRTRASQLDRRGSAEAAPGGGYLVKTFSPQLQAERKPALQVGGTGLGLSLPLSLNPPAARSFHRRASATGAVNAALASATQGSGPGAAGAGADPTQVLQVQDLMRGRYSSGGTGASASLYGASRFSLSGTSASAAAAAAVMLQGPPAPLPTPMQPGASVATTRAARRGAHIPLGPPALQTPAGEDRTSGGSRRSSAGTGEGMGAASGLLSPDNMSERGTPTLPAPPSRMPALPTFLSRSRARAVVTPEPGVPGGQGSSSTTSPSTAAHGPTSPFAEGGSDPFDSGPDRGTPRLPAPPMGSFMNPLHAHLQQQAAQQQEQAQRARQQQAAHAQPDQAGFFNPLHARRKQQQQQQASTSQAAAASQQGQDGQGRSSMDAPSPQPSKAKFRR